MNDATGRLVCIEEAPGHYFVSRLQRTDLALGKLRLAHDTPVREEQQRGATGASIRLLALMEELESLKRAALAR
jgi:hypothetical protein